MHERIKIALTYYFIFSRFVIYNLAYNMSEKFLSKKSLMITLHPMLKRTLRNQKRLGLPYYLPYGDHLLQRLMELRKKLGWVQLTKRFWHQDYLWGHQSVFKYQPEWWDEIVDGPWILDHGETKQ